MISTLRKILTKRNFQLHVLNENEHLPQKFAPLYAVVGVHGGAFGNIIACARGTVIIEVIGALMPRMWANFATALGMRYFAYVAERFPRSLWSFHAHSDGATNVQVNTTRFAQFVADALDATNGVESQCGAPSTRKPATTSSRRMTKPLASDEMSAADTMFSAH